MINEFETQAAVLPQPALVHKKETVPRIGVFGVGYYKYWDQFPGLLDALLAKQTVFIAKLHKHEVDVIDFGLIDNVEKAYKLTAELKASNLDLIFCDMLTYATSSTFGTIIKTIDVPIVLVALQPDDALDYENASTYQQLYNDDICSLPEFAGVAVRMGKAVPEMIIGTLQGDLQAEEAISEYIILNRIV